LGSSIDFDSRPYNIFEIADPENPTIHAKFVSNYILQLRRGFNVMPREI